MSGPMVFAGSFNYSTNRCTYADVSEKLDKVSP